MNELIVLYKDLLKLQDQQEIRKGLRQTSFWLGLGFIVSLMVVISFLYSNG